MESNVVINFTDFCPINPEAIRIMIPEFLSAVLRNTVGVGSLCALYNNCMYCTIVHSSNRAQ